MLGLKPIKLMPVRERVASALRKAIISKQIPEGSVLALETTAQELGVSITPVREAFQILERDGLLELKQNKGAVVRGVTEQTLRNHYQVRAALECMACELCCTNGTDLSGIRNTVETAARDLAEGDASRYSDYNQSLHFEIWQASGNDKLQRMLMELWNGLSVGVKMTEMEYAKKSHSEHLRLVDALEARDVDRAVQEMHHHIFRSLEDALTHYL